MALWDRLLIFLSRVVWAPRRSQDTNRITTDYYPLKVGNEWVYRCNDGIQPAFQETVNVIDAERFVYSATDGEGHEVTQELTGFTLVTKVHGVETTDKVAVLPDGVYRFQLDHNTVTPPFRFLAIHPRDGMSWQSVAETSDAELQGIFKLTLEDVQVPAGTFSAIKVVMTSDGEERSAVIFWYAPNVGLVKRHHRIGNEDTLIAELGTCKIHCMELTHLPACPFRSVNAYRSGCPVERGWL